MHTNKLGRWFAVWLACFALSCVKSTEAPQLGTNTNWLKTCDSSAECGDERACLCGVCTQPCSEDAQCAGVHASTQCATLSNVACDYAPGVSAACLQGCRSSAECTAFEHGMCVDGLCVAAPPAEMGGAGPSGDPYALRREGPRVPITDAYVECSRDADCTLVEASCDSCCRTSAIRSDLGQTYAENRTLACTGYNGPECDCQPPDVEARCDLGRCLALPAP